MRFLRYGGLDKTTFVSYCSNRYSNDSQRYSSNSGDPMHAAVKHIEDATEELKAERGPSNELGRLTDQAAKILIDSGGFRLLQAKSHGGYEADITDFLAWVRAVARANPSAGWIAGVVGVHPWEIALHVDEVQNEIFGDDPTTLAASPYAPMGRAIPVEGGYKLTGQWQYSTGTDHCDWVILGGIVVDESAPRNGPPPVLHFILPRGDYEIIEDSWHVMGLEGTGSKDIRIDGAFVPEYRTISHSGLSDGDYGHRRGDTPLYQLPFGCVFSASITAATFGIAQANIDAYRDYLTTRVSAMGVVGTTDPYQQQALAEAEADLAAGIAHIDAMFNDWIVRVTAGEKIDNGERLEFRRNQVRAVQRVLDSVNTMMSRAGTAAVWTTRELEQLWRDLRTGGTHLSNSMDLIYNAWANDEFGTGVERYTFH